MSGGRAGISAPVWLQGCSPSPPDHVPLHLPQTRKEGNPRTPGRGGTPGSGPGSQVGGGPSGFALLPPVRVLLAQSWPPPSLWPALSLDSFLKLSHQRAELRCHLIWLPVKEVGSSTQTHTFTRVLVFSKTHIGALTSPHTFMCTHIHIHSDTHPQTFTLNTFTHILIHTLTYTYTHANTHLHIHHPQVLTHAFMGSQHLHLGNFIAHAHMHSHTCAYASRTLTQCTLPHSHTRTPLTSCGGAENTLWCEVRRPTPKTINPGGGEKYAVGFDDSKATWNNWRAYSSDTGSVLRNCRL